MTENNKFGFYDSKSVFPALFQGRSCSGGAISEMWLWKGSGPSTSTAGWVCWPTDPWRSAVVVRFCGSLKLHWPWAFTSSAHWAEVKAESTVVGGKQKQVSHPHCINFIMNREMEHDGFMPSVCVRAAEWLFRIHWAAWPSDVRRTSHLIHNLWFFLSLVCESFHHFVKYSRHCSC